MERSIRLKGGAIPDSQSSRTVIGNSRGEIGFPRDTIPDRHRPGDPAGSTKFAGIDLDWTCAGPGTVSAGNKEGAGVNRRCAGVSVSPGEGELPVAGLGQRS